MDQKTERLYPSAPLENIELEQRLERKLNDVNSFNNSINNIKKMTTYFKDKNNKSKKKNEKYKMITTKIESIDKNVILATTTSLHTLSFTGIGLIAIPISTATTCGLSIGDQIIYEIMINKNSRYKKQYEKDKQTKKLLR